MLCTLCRRLISVSGHVNKLDLRSSQRHLILTMRIASGLPTLIAYLAPIALCSGGSDTQKTFASPTAAVSSLVTSIRNGDYALYISTLGPEMSAAWSTGDPVRDALDRERFLTDMDCSSFKQDQANPNRMILYLGVRGEPFPAPLIRSEHGWGFDGVAGSQEVARRRIHRNELAAADLCLQYVEAQFSYSTADQGQGDFAFARRIRATSEDHGGLYWSGEGLEDQSPEGPLFAAAAYTESQPPDTPHPYFGYYFKILLGQGPDATGGALDYQVDGKLVRGFALIAWPAEYRVTGTNSFLVNHQGTLYERDLGLDTQKIAVAMTAFNPDPNWTRVIPDSDGEEK